MCSLNDIAKWLLERDDIAVISHERPDGDAVGSSVALRHALASLGKRAVSLSSDPIPRMYGFLPGADEIITGEELPFEPKAYISVDVSVLARMGKYADRYENASEKIAVDHHGSNEGFGDLCYIEPHTAASGEIILRLIKLMGAEVTWDIAECLYAAITTDCGNFSFNNTSPETLMSAAECVGKGVNVENMTRTLFRLRSLGTTRMLGAALSMIETSPDGRIAMIAFPRSMYERFGCKMSDSHAFVNYLNEIDGVHIGIMIDEVEGGVKISFRGAYGTDVAALAKQFGGGGHSAAAGASVPGVTLEEAAQRVMAAAVSYLESL